jgi:hypothetical protein
MSLIPGFAPDARSQWQALGIHLQELVLDELDRVAMAALPTGEHVIDTVREEGGKYYCVFLHVFVSRERNRMTVLGLGCVPVNALGAP